MFYQTYMPEGTKDGTRSMRFYGSSYDFDGEGRQDGKPPSGARNHTLPTSPPVVCYSTVSANPVLWERLAVEEAKVPVTVRV
jgi:hypothetical protein